MERAALGLVTKADLIQPRHQSFSLPDGRQLGYAEYGLPNGRPVLFFHGAPGSAYLHADMAHIAAQLGVKLIAVERPGYGLSDPHPARTLSSWADDVAALTDALALPQFAIVGFSGGTPYALACASKLPDRVTKVALFSALAPLDAPGVTVGLSPLSGGLYALARSNPDELRATFSAIASSPFAMLEAISAPAVEWEQKVLHERTSEFESEYARALLGGIEGMASDFVLYVGDWGSPLESIAAEIHLWSGAIDQFTPPAMADYLASRLANCRTFKLPGEGHFALYRHWREVLEQLLA